MKKLTSLLIVTMMVFSVALQAKNTKVTTKSEFTAAFGALADGDTITVNYNGGQVLKIGKVTLSAAGGCFYFRGESPDSLPQIQIEINGVTLPETTTYGLVFENIHLQYRSPGGASGQIIYFNKIYANMDSLIFRNCEITESVRSVFRSVKPDNIKDISGNDSIVYTSCGDVDYFEMSNCLVHNTTYTSGNNWPIIYFGHLPVEINFRNNTFYDMPYVKSLFTMNYADPSQGRNAVINFENNTVTATSLSGGLISPGTYLGEEAQFNINNNLIVLPNWVNDRNLADTSFAAPKLVVARYGMISAKNNVIQGYRDWKAGQSLDDLGNGEFLSLDTVPQYTMEQLGVSFADFTDPASGDFSYLFNNPLATAGSDGGPIGDPRWVMKYNNPRSFEATASINEAVVTPAKGVYESGDEVTVTASDVVGFTFKNWQDTLGAVISTANPYTFAITADVNLVAYYDTLKTRTVTINLKGTNTASYTITPKQDQYYAGDIITTTLDLHGINEFTGWSDNQTTLARVDTLNDNLTLTAHFVQAPYVLSWDFCDLTGNNQTFANHVANHALDTANVGLMYYIAADTLAPTFSTRNNKFTGLELNNCMVRKTPAAYFNNPDYLVVRFSTKDLNLVGIKSKIASDNCIFQVQKVQYSLDGKAWEDVASITLPADTTFNKVWYDLNGQLPQAAEGKDSVFVRWIADPTSARSALSSSDQSFEYAYISKVVVTAAEDMGGASWRVNPIAEYKSGQVITSVPGIRLTLGGGANVWSTADSVNTFGEATYIASINGTVNPLDSAVGGKTFSSSGNPPKIGTFYKFDVEFAGTLDVAVIVNANKTSYIVEDRTALPDYNGFTVTSKTYTSYSIPVKAGSSYYFFSQGSKMGLMGFVYKTTSALKPAYEQTGMYTANGLLFVEATKEEEISVYDLSGRMVANLKLQVGTNEISGLNKGMYLVRRADKTTKVVL